jgi:hypothetical protein
MGLVAGRIDAIFIPLNHFDATTIICLSIGGVAVAQPSDIDGDVKFLNALTMENIADAAVNDNLATRDEVEHLIETLHQGARDERSFASVMRRIQVWGRRPQ